MNGKIGIRAAMVALLVAGTLGASASEASTVVTFDWVSTAASGGSTTPSGVLTLTLPTITSGSAAGTFTSTGASAAEVTGFSFTFSDGATLNLAQITGAGNTISVGSTWATSNSLAPAGASTGFYLITSLTLGGHEIFAGTTTSGLYQIADSAGLVGNVALNSATVTPGSPLASSNDSGYWKLQTAAPVPLPAALPLLLSGLGGLSMLRRRRLTPA